MGGVIRGKGAEDIINGFHQSPAHVQELACVALCDTNEIIDKNINDLQPSFEGGQLGISSGVAVGRKESLGS